MYNIELDSDGDVILPEIYKRQARLGVEQDQKVAVIGVGGIGSWIALYLGLAGIREMDLFDSDTISEHNLNRFPLGPASIGVNKAEAMASHIMDLRQDVLVNPRQNFDPEVHGHLLQEYRWVIVTTDSLKSRQMVYKHCVDARGFDPNERKHGWPGYIECGADGHHATITFSPATSQTAAEDEPGYASVPVFVGPCTMAASVAAYYVLLGPVRDYERTLRVDWIAGSPLEASKSRVAVTEINEADDPEPLVPRTDGVLWPHYEFEDRAEEEFEDEEVIEADPEGHILPTEMVCYCAIAPIVHGEIVAHGARGYVAGDGSNRFFICDVHLPLYRSAELTQATRVRYDIRML